MTEQQLADRREKARLRMALFRKTPEYKEWLNKSRDYRNAHKTRYRRISGAEPIELRRERSEAKKAANEKRRLAKADFLANFIGPPRPNKAMTPSEHYAWRTRNDPDFYARELDRAQRYKARTRPGYWDSIVGWSAMPDSVKQVKHLQYLIARQIERSEEHENHQRAA